jgi:hypothetical protein
MNIAIQKPQQALAWRIEFADRALGGELPQIREPRSAWVHIHEVNAPAALLDTTAPEGAVNGLTFVFLATGVATPFEVQKHAAESWMAPRPGEDGVTLEVQFRSERLLWRRGRALCFGSPQAAAEVLAGVSRFTFCESELSRLEQQVQTSWLTLEGDMELMKRLSSRDLKRQEHINAMTRTATTMSVAYVRLQAALETSPRDLTGPARRLFLELALQADAVDRLRRLDDAIEVLEDFYGDMREQLSEFRYFKKEYLVTFLILLVLVGEFLISIERFVGWQTPAKGQYILPGAASESPIDQLPRAASKPLKPDARQLIDEPN